MLKRLPHNYVRVHPKKDTSLEKDLIFEARRRRRDKLIVLEVKDLATGTIVEEDFFKFEFVFRHYYRY